MRVNRFTRIHQNETTGTVGALHHPRMKAGLSIRGRLLIARDAGDGNAFTKEFFRRVGRRATAGHHRWKNRARNAQYLQQLIIPIQRMNIEQHRTRGITGVRDVFAREFVN